MASSPDGVGGGAVDVGVSEGVGVSVGGRVAVIVGVSVGVAVSVAVGVAVGSGVTVGGNSVAVGEGVDARNADALQPTTIPATARRKTVFTNRLRR